MKPWKLILAFIAVFVAGGIIGALAVMHFVRPPFGSPPPADKITQHIIKDLRGTLHLSPSQAAKIEPIITQNVKELINFHRELEAHVQSSLDASDKQVEEVLDPAQKAEFAKFRAHRPHLPSAP